MSEETKAQENSPTEARPVEQSEKVKADEVVKPDEVQPVAEEKKDGPEELSAEEYVKQQEAEKKQKRVQKAMADIQKILDDNGLAIEAQADWVQGRNGGLVQRLESVLIDKPKSKKA